MSVQPDPSHILQVGMGFWPSKALLSALELEVFTRLGDGSMSAGELGKSCGLHPRGISDFFDTLVALGFLQKDDTESQVSYRNTAATEHFLDKNSASYIGGFLEMCNARLYHFWGDLTEALQTGKPQNEIKHTGKPLFAELYSQPERLEQFMTAMEGLSRINFEAFAQKFDFSRYRILCDVGGANGLLSLTAARKHPHLQCYSLRPSSGRAHSSKKPRKARNVGPGPGGFGRLFKGLLPQGRPRDDGDDPSRLEPRKQEDADS